MHGMRKWDASTNREHTTDKIDGRQLEPSDMQSFLSRFFAVAGTGSPPDRSVVEAVCTQIDRLLEIFERQEAFHFYTSSLLLYYDQDDPLHTAGVCMIDFAFTYHVSEILMNERLESKRDEGYVFGLRNLAGLLRAIAADQTYTPHTPTSPSLVRLLHPSDAPAPESTQ